MNINFTDLQAGINYVSDGYKSPHGPHVLCIHTSAHTHQYNSTEGISHYNLWWNSTGYVLVSYNSFSCSGWDRVHCTAMVQPENHMRACAIKDRVTREIPSRAYLARITDVQSLSTVS